MFTLRCEGAWSPVNRPSTVRNALLGIALASIAALLIACGGDSFGDLNDAAQGDGGDAFSLGATEDEFPDELADFPRPEGGMVHCPCEPLPDSRMTIAMLITTPISADELIAFFDEALEAAGYEITNRETDDMQAFYEFVKNGHPGQVHVFPNVGGETSANVNYFTAQEP